MRRHLACRAWMGRQPQTIASATATPKKSCRAVEMVLASDRMLQTACR